MDEQSLDDLAAAIRDREAAGESARLSQQVLAELTNDAREKVSAAGEAVRHVKEAIREHEVVTEAARLAKISRDAEGSPAWGAACMRLAERGMKHYSGEQIAVEMADQAIADERAIREAPPTWERTGVRPV